jgi:beta-lactamase superfamily II metal-dependent hydrolase
LAEVDNRMICKSLAFAALALGATLGAGVWAQGQGTKTLDIWVVDVEGGKAALYVTPSGQSVLVDSGWPGFEGRDPDRIMAAVADAGLKQIDYMLSTHYHVDHVGGLQELAKRIPIAHYVDHGPTVEGPLTSLREQVPGFWEAYGKLHGSAKRLVVRPGDRVPVAGVDWRIVTAAGDLLKKPLEGGGKPNPACDGFTPRTDKSNLRDPDDAQSVGSVIQLGEFRAIDLGDLWWTKELEMMCPVNPIGTVDLFFASSHGSDASNARPLVHGLQPRVALLQNGPRKGGSVDAIKTIRASPGLEDVWQMHWSYNAGIELNSAGVYIANVDDPAAIAAVLTGSSGERGGGRGSTPAPQHNPAFWLKISAQPDGTFIVTNTRNGFSKTYTRRAARR